MNRMQGGQIYVCSILCRTRVALTYVIDKVSDNLNVRMTTQPQNDTWSGDPRNWCGSVVHANLQAKKSSMRDGSRMDLGFARIQIRLFGRKETQLCRHNAPEIEWACQSLEALHRRQEGVKKSKKNRGKTPSPQADHVLKFTASDHPPRGAVIWWFAARRVDFDHLKPVVRINQEDIEPRSPLRLHSSLAPHVHGVPLPTRSAFILGRRHERTSYSYLFFPFTVSLVTRDHHRRELLKFAKILLLGIIGKTQSQRPQNTKRSRTSHLMKAGYERTGKGLGWLGVYTRLNSHVQGAASGSCANSVNQVPSRRTGHSRNRTMHGDKMRRKEFTR